MKTFKFEITLTEEDLEGDKFWEEALERDGTGITALKEYLAQMIEDSNLIVGSTKEPIEIIKLISYTEV